MSDELFTVETSKSPELQWMEEAKAAGIRTLHVPANPSGFEWSAWCDDIAQIVYAETEMAAMDDQCAAYKTFPTFDQWKLQQRKEVAK